MKYKCSTCLTIHNLKVDAEKCHTGQQYCYVAPNAVQIPVVCTDLQKSKGAVPEQLNLIKENESNEIYSSSYTDDDSL